MRLSLDVGMWAAVSDVSPCRPLEILTFSRYGFTLYTDPFLVCTALTVMPH
jgi:hypothetical protein